MKNGVPDARCLLKSTFLKTFIRRFSVLVLVSVIVVVVVAVVVPVVVVDIVIVVFIVPSVNVPHLSLIETGAEVMFGSRATTFTGTFHGTDLFSLGLVTIDNR